MELTYIHHDAFALALEDAENTILLFDAPGAQHRPPAAAELIEALVSDKRVVCFISYSHADHFDPELRALLEPQAESVTFFVSEDVADLSEAFNPEHREDVHIVEPGGAVHQDEFVVHGFESTDLGVGFLIEWPGGSVWFGGDVARWSWPNQDDAARAFADDHFRKTLEELRGKAVRGLDIAFVNADPRLTHWAGGVEFARRLKPRLLVPMHCFGQVEALRAFARELNNSQTTFLYTHPGDTYRPTL